MGKRAFTSGSAARGQPDKLCDQIADRILDEILEQDPEARVACEVICCTDRVHIFGEIATDAQVDCESAARRVIAGAGYTRPGRGFDAENCRIGVELHPQSPDIARGIRRKGGAEERLNAGAGDQGTVFGFACRETGCLMPLPIELAHSLCRRLEAVRRSGELPFLLPDGKAQVTVEYRDGVPARAGAVVLSAQHEEDVDIDTVRESILGHVILPALPGELVDAGTEIFINPTGRFVLGGPAADAGLTGRKTAADTYGGSARHGGGSLSGKDASKVARSGAYMARYMAKNVVAAGLADRCEVQLSYAVGLAEPMSVSVETFGTAVLPESELIKRLLDAVDLRPAAITELLDLTAPRFSRLSCYGHFGANAAGMPWERTDLAERIRERG